MANAVEDALNRASAEQKERNQQVIEEARSNIKLVSMQQDITPTGADTIAQNAQAIEDAKRAIPFETMQSVDSIGPPLNTPSPSVREPNSNVIQLNAGVQSTIENIQQDDGNNYLAQNAVDRAMARPSQDIARPEQEQALGR